MSDSVWISVNRPQIMRIFSVDENSVYSSKTDEGVSGQLAGGFFENRMVEHLEFIPKDQTVYVEYCCNVLKSLRETGREAVQHNTTCPLRAHGTPLDWILLPLTSLCSLKGSLVSGSQPLIQVWGLR